MQPLSRRTSECAPNTARSSKSRIPADWFLSRRWLLIREPKQAVEELKGYGLEELSDGSTINNMATIGQLRNNAQQLELRIKQLETERAETGESMTRKLAFGVDTGPIFSTVHYYVHES